MAFLSWGRWLFCSLLMLLLVGCGWQLQTVRPMPPELLPLYLELADTQSVFSRVLLQNLELAGIEMTRDRSRARSVLVVTQDLSSRQVSSVSARNKPQQYQIDYRVEYRFDRHDEATNTQTSLQPVNIIPTQLLSVSRAMSYDINLALAKEREAESVEELLAQQITQQVMRRLNSVAISQSPVH